MLETFIVAVLLIFLNLFFAIKRLPVIGIPIAILTIYISATKFLIDTTIPVNPLFTILVVLFAIGNIFANALDMNK